MVFFPIHACQSSTVSIMSIVKRLAGQSSFFLLGNLFTLIVGFVFQIYLAKQLGASGLGVFGVLESCVGVGTALLGFGIAQTMMRFIPGHVQNNEISEVRLLVGRGFIYTALSGAVGCLFVYLLLPVIIKQWPTLQGYEIEMVVMSLMIPLGMLNFLSTQVLRGFYDVVHIVVGSSFLQLTMKVLVAIIMFSFGMHLLGYIWAVIISTLVALSWSVFGVRRHLHMLLKTEPIEMKLLPEWKKYAGVMYGNSLLSFWSVPLDRFLLGAFLGANVVGVLMVAKMIFALPGIFLQMFLAIVAPMLSSAHAAGKADEVQRIYHLCTDWLVRISFPLIVFLMIYAEPVLGIFGSEFADEGVTLLRILLVAQFVSLACGPIGNVLNMCGLEKMMFRISLLNVIVSTMILVVLVPFYGLPGVGLSVFFGTVYPNLAALYVAKKNLKLKWWDRNFNKWILPAISTVLLASLFSWKFDGMGNAGLFFTLVMAYIVFHSVQLFFYGMNDDDREVYGMVSKRFKKSESIS
jgi:O-antigen/teichoic acid export membrane protein